MTPVEMPFGGVKMSGLGRENGTAAVVIVALWLSAFALFAVFVQVVSTDRVRRKFLRAGPYIDIGAGAFFVVVGITLIVRGAMTL